MAYADPRVPKMATPRFVVITSPQFANFLHRQEASAEDAGYLATTPSHCVEQFRRPRLGVLVHEDNIIAALEHPDRVCEIGFNISSETLEI